jgi:BirA family biotin operon repressor/biotin-[acetyl-CoA-carboxylase] ligase
MQDDIENFLKNSLDTDFIGKNIYHYESITSTMEMGKHLASEGAVEGTIIIADKQTTGKGRLNRIWLSPENNLAISIVLRPTFPTMLKLIMVASVAVVRAIKEITEIDAWIKWPNDIMVRGKKVCGILIENEIKSGKPSFSIIGIGINIDINLSEFTEIASIATSLSVEAGHTVQRTELTCVLLSELEKLYLEAQKSNLVYEEWQRNMEALGKVVRVQSSNTVEQGKAEGVTQNGNLLLRHTDGSISEIVAGDVTIVKG